MAIHRGEAARPEPVVHVAEKFGPTACGLAPAAIPFMDNTTGVGRNATCPACRDALSRDVVSGYRR
ncbi:hypothetical protein FHR83_007058 [Actinoplanes campanulatus]|uniref:Uncharacterized protein n=1 Tax=Actinoplanes campanulatus TaxID=113559 RepID=A0A7W5ANN4_9ACTN|nr:hypothetical protein [Actinoplanes campanulatus]MBB3099352.1 hypothetical protein [Actinoplanes campanulatus]GGN40346.1 hypothetical protein GCM10010109_69340 [Actinoplanes campanulatus]GID40669.1 hypothetical protein Aca09nite_71750 [Actinoplanes campanulatus]